MEEHKLLVALVKAQQEILPPKKDKYNSHHKYWYASLDAIYEAIRIPLAKNGLSLTHSAVNTDSGYNLITTLYHISGAEIFNKMPLLIGKVDSQGLGSALTYSRRYAICSLLALPTEEDDDGTQAVKQQSQTVSQNSEPEELITYNESLSIEESMSSEGDAFRNQMLKYFSGLAKIEPPVDEFFKMPKRFLNQIVAGIKKKKEAKNEAV